MGWLLFCRRRSRRGRRWLEELLKALRESQIGLVSLMPECLGAPWIHFEAGALASVMDEVIRFDGLDFEPRGVLKIAPRSSYQ